MISFKVLNRRKTLHVKIILFLFIILFVLCWQKLSYLNALFWIGFVHRWANDEFIRLLTLLRILTLVDDTIDYTLICRVQLFSVDEFFRMLRFDAINSPCWNDCEWFPSEISNFSLYFDVYHKDKSLYEIAPNGVVLYSHQSIHRKMNNNDNRLALGYRR